jgi:hypothetical protein
VVILKRKASWKEVGTGWGWWRGFLMLECPQGHRARINTGADGHKVAADGAVSPSCVCPGEAKPCGFHEYVKLDGWTVEEAAKREQDFDAEGP